MVKTALSLQSELAKTLLFYYCILCIALGQAGKPQQSHPKDQAMQP